MNVLVFADSHQLSPTINNFSNKAKVCLNILFGMITLYFAFGANSILYAQQKIIYSNNVHPPSVNSLPTHYVGNNSIIVDTITRDPISAITLSENTHGTNGIILSSTGYKQWITINTKPAPTKLLPSIFVNGKSHQNSLMNYTPIVNDMTRDWVIRAVPNVGSNASISNVLPTSIDDIIVAGDNALRITTNGGNSWRTVSLPESFRMPAKSSSNRLTTFAVRTSASVIHLIGERQIGDIIIQRTGLGIDSTNPATWKYFADIESAILTTSDKGETWNISFRSRQVREPFDRNRMTFSFSTSQNGTVFLNRDSILVTNDGGSTWQSRRISRKGDMFPIQLIHTTNGNICLNYTGLGTVTFGDKSGTGGLCLISKDNGLTWQEQALPRGGVLHITAQNKWYLCHESTVRSNNKSDVFMSMSTDEGQTWNTVFSQSWNEGRGGDRIASKNKTLVMATRGSFSPIMGQLLPISEDEGVTWNYPVFPDSLFGTLDNNGGVISGGIANPLMGFLDIWLGNDGIVGLAGDGKTLVIGKKKGNTGTSVNEESTAQGLVIYPNPASTQLHLVSQSQDEDILAGTMLIVNTLGIEVTRVPTTETIDVSSLANGAYFLRATTTNGKTITKPFVIER